jgi:hypothetical protein
MAIRFTPVHLQALALIHDGRIVWRTRTRPLGGFAGADGHCIPPGVDLVALYELWNAQLIVVDRQSGRVAAPTTGLNLCLTKRRSAARTHPRLLAPTA